MNQTDRYGLNEKLILPVGTQLLTPHMYGR